jgi:hypothetical protein
MVGRALPDALRCLDAAEELRDVLLVQELAVLAARLRPDDEGRAVGTAEQGNRRRS